MATAPSEWTLQLRDNIKRLMFRYNLEDDYKHFITHENLVSAWNQEIDSTSPLTCLRQELGYFSSVGDEAFRDHWIRVVSILIWIRHDGWSEFLQSSLDSKWDRPRSKTKTKTKTNHKSDVSEDCSATFRDEYLPFKKDELRQYLFKDSSTEVETEKDFFEAQFAFKPIFLRQNELISFDDQRYRLPIKQEGDVNDTGAYGFVAKVRIVGNHYFYQPEVSTNFEPYPSDFDAARKEFDVGYDFAREHHNLQILKSTGIQHSRIMQSFASVILDQKYNLFFPWADLDLARFLQAQYLYDDQEADITPYALMKEALELLDALKFLHESVKMNGEDVVFSHLDLKPNNIVVTKDNDRSRYPVGKWKITDFGISSTEPRQEDDNRFLSSRELFMSKTDSSAELERYPGPFQPPEAEKTVAELFKQMHIRTPGDRSDIWSYGCVIISILAFAIGGSRYTETLNNKLQKGGACPDGKWRTGYFYRRSSDDKFQLEPHINAWFGEALPQNQDWLADLWKIMGDKMLQPYPPKRRSAKDISTALKPLIEDRLPRTNIWSQISCRDDEDDDDDADTAVEDSPSSEASTAQQTGELPTGKIIAFDVGQAKFVQSSPDGLSIAYRASDRIAVFQASEDTGVTTFASPKTHTFAMNGHVHWNQFDVSGDYVALRSDDHDCDRGKIEIHNLSLDSAQDQSRWMNQVDSEFVTGICVSSRGCVAVRYSKSVSIFTSRLSGDPTHMNSRDVLTNLRDGVKDVAFDRSGQIFIVMLSNHWFIQRLDDDSDPITGSHKFRRDDHGKFLPSITPFTQVASFLLHDSADPGRCLAIIQNPNKQSMFLQRDFRLDDSLKALAITPDNKRLIYVIAHKHGPLKKRCRYSIRSRSIEVEGRNPISTRDVWRMDNAFELNKELDISIAAVSTSTGYMVLIAVVNGAVYYFPAE